MKILDEGANVIIGHHPHVLQDFECYTTADGRKGIVFYSLGNWTTAMNPVYTKTTSVVKLLLSEEEEPLAVRKYPSFFDKSCFSLYP
ncbi:MAG: hypothetical protein PWQ27_982 [Kosmotoga sp.]|nr:hypothetical protein [Kosmotoga sp.]